jgi:nucleotide-binding universal stress UspA family protein
MPFAVGMEGHSVYTRIVVPLDGSALAEVALTHANELARRLEVPMQLVRVVDSGPVGPFNTFGLPADYPPFAELLAQEQAESTRYLEETSTRLRAEGFEVEAVTRVGLVAPTLLEYAQTGDLYVLASHGRGGVTRWFMGSIAEDITRRSSVPVLLVRADGADDRTRREG